MNLADAVALHARARPVHPAVVEGQRVVTYEQLQAQILAAAARLQEAGVGAGDVVCVALESSAAYLAVAYAVALLGGILLPVDPQETEAERLRTTSRFGAKVALAPPGAGAFGCPVLSIDSAWFSPGGASPRPTSHGDADAPFVLTLSSGTTGRSKAMLLTQRQLHARLLNYSLTTGAYQGDRYLSIASMSNTVGRNLGMTFLQLGATVIINRSRTIAELVADAAARRVTWMNIVPAQLRELLAQPSEGRVLLPSLRMLAVGSSMLRGQERLAAHARLTPNLHEMYGANEIGFITMATPQDQLAVPESVGRAAVGIEIEIVDSEHRPLPPGKVGLLRARASWMPTAYHEDAEATAASFRDGWFYPGDIAAMDEGGYVLLKGRADDLINCEGLKIDPTEVEAVLQAHAGVAEAAVVGYPVRGDEVPVGCVVARAPVAEQDLIAHCRARLAPVKVPRRIVFLAELPKTENGKLKRAALRTALAARKGGGP